MGFLDRLKSKFKKEEKSIPIPKEERRPKIKPEIDELSSQALGVLALLKKHDERVLGAVASVKEDTLEIPNIRNVLNVLNSRLRSRVSKEVRKIELNLKLQEVLDFVNDREYTSVKETSIVLSMPKSTVSSYLKNLHSLGLIKRIGYGKYSELTESSEHSEL